MKKTLLFIGGLTVLGVGVYSYLKKQKDLLMNFTWKIQGFKILKFTKDEVAIDLNILFTSVSDVEAKIERLYLDLFLDGKNVGFVSENNPFIIPAKGSATIPLKISVNPRGLFNNLIDLTLGVFKNKDLMFAVNGFAKIKSGLFYTTLPIKYETSVKEYLGKK